MPYLGSNNKTTWKENSSESAVFDINMYNKG